MSLKLSKNEVLLVQIPGKYSHSCYNIMQFNTVKELPTTALLAAKKQVWCLAIKHGMTPLGVCLRWSMMTMTVSPH